MKNLSQTIEGLHFEHRLWKSECSFYSDEMQILTGHLHAIANWQAGEVENEQINFFKEQFAILGKTLMELEAEIKTHEHTLAQMEKETQQGESGGLMEHHGEAKRKFEQFKQQYAALKKEFMEFLEKNKEEL